MYMCSNGKWNARNDKIEPASQPQRLYTELFRHTGLTRTEVEEAMAEKKKILDWLVDHKIRKISQVGKVFNNYYVNRESVLDVIDNDGNPKEILGDQWDDTII